MGIGKTQLAKRYAYHFSSQYDLIAWLNADETLPLQLQALLDSLKGKDPNPEASFPLDYLLESLAKELRRRKVECLLILDHVENLQTLSSYITLTRDAPVHLLVTTRAQTTPYPTFPVRVFSRKESCAFLRKTLPQTSSADCEILAKALGDHPLALSLAAGFIRFTQDSTIHDYLNLTARHQETHPLVFTDRYPHDLQTGLTLLMHSLKQKSPEAHRLLQFLSHLHCNQIPLSLVKRWLKAEGMDAYEAVRVLRDASLLEIQEDKKPTLIEVHPLLHQFICDSLTDHEREGFLEKAIFLVAPTFAGQSAAISKRILRRPEFFLHAKHISTLAHTLGYHSMPLLSLRIRLLHYLHSGLRDFEQAKKLLNLIGDDERFLKSPDFLEETPLDILLRPKLSLEDQVILETERGFLAAALEMDWKVSLIHGKRALALLDHGEDSPDERLRVSLNMLQAYLFTGQISSAATLLEAARPLAETCVSPVRRMIFILLNAELLTLSGKFDAAITLLEQNEPFLKKLAYHPPTTTAFWRAKAEALVRSARREEAAQTLKKLHAEIHTFYGKRERPILATTSVLRVLNNLETPRSEDAVPMLQKALAIYENAWHGKEKSLYQGFTHYVLGRVYEKRGENTSALRAYQEAERIYGRVLHTKTIHDVSLLYAALCKLALLLNNGILAHAYFKKHSLLFGEEHPRTIELMRICGKHLRTG